MLKSLYSGINGMKVNQTKLDVIGNNISNVGTTAYKSSTARFSDMLSQNVGEAMAPSSTQGGVNAKQVGLGVQLSSIATIMTQGNLQLTNRSLDVAIDGAGYFMVSQGPAVFDDSLKVNHQVGTHNLANQGEGSTSNIMYTRDGSFTLDEQGNLLTSDGNRVLGYSLTNDDNSKEATGLIPNSVNLAGLDFDFGPGGQLNEYKVVLGNVGPGTVTSADINKDNKTIIVNGDFSTVGALTPAQVESAVNKALSSAGISQRVAVKGKAMNIEDIASTPVINGKDATAPNMISFGGFTIKFAEGKDLNGYVFKTGQVAEGTDTSVKLDKDNKEIIVNGDFKKRGFTAEDLEILINGAIKKGGLNQSVTIVGNPSRNVAEINPEMLNSDPILGGINENNSVDPPIEAVAPEKVSIAGFNISFSEGASLNGYRFEIGETKVGAAAHVTVDDSKKKIIINGDFTNVHTFNADILKGAIDNALGSKNMTVTVTEDPDNDRNSLFVGSRSESVQGGEDYVAPDLIEVGGLTLELSEGASLNGYKFTIGTITPGTKSSTNIDKASKTITINGDFVTGDAITIEDIENSINKAFREQGISQSVKVAGIPIQISGAVSEETNGGTPIESINEDGSIYFVDATKELRAYDGELKTLRIPEKIKIPGTDQELRIKSYTIDNAGIINGILEDGTVAALGQIAMASFRNAEGLTKLGGNMYSASVNSGEAVIKSGIGTIGDDNSQGYGDNVQGMLEMSNVDLAEQFTDMIVASRAFQASGKMITTGDEILQDIINLKR
mgnify:FL=1